jgi:hypothetical protein
MKMTSKEFVKELGVSEDRADAILDLIQEAFDSNNTKSGAIKHLRERLSGDELVVASYVMGQSIGERETKMRLMLGALAGI